MSGSSKSVSVFSSFFAILMCARDLKRNRVDMCKVIIVNKPEFVIQRLRTTPIAH